MKTAWVILVAMMGMAGSSSGDNLATNSGFEDQQGMEGGIPSGWFFFSSKNQNASVTAEDRRLGTQCLKLWAQSIPNASEGIGQKIAVIPGETYRIRGFVRNNGKEPLQRGGEGSFGIEWKNGEGREIGRVESDVWDSGLSKIRWEEFGVKAKAPDDAVEAVFAVYLRDGEKGTTGGFYVDDVDITGPDRSAADAQRGDAAAK